MGDTILMSIFQGIVVTCLTCGGLRNDCFIVKFTSEFVSEKIFTSTNIWQRCVMVFPFFDSCLGSVVLGKIAAAVSL